MRSSVSIRIRPRVKILNGVPDALPFLGVFFLLLIFFMLSSSFVQVSGIPVDLPVVSTRSSFGIRKLVVTVAKTGKMYFNDMEFTDINRFKNLLMGFVNNASRERTTLILRADEGASFGTVARILSTAEELKVNVFVLTSAPPEHVSSGIPIRTE